MSFTQDMINQAPRCWLNNIQGQNSLTLTSDKALSSQKKEQYHSRHSIHAKLTRLYFEELAKVPHATPDSVLVGSSFKSNLTSLHIFILLEKKYYFASIARIFVCEHYFYYINFLL